jgi:hypothetical protein
MLEMGRATETGGFVIIVMPKATVATSIAAPNETIVFIPISIGRRVATTWWRQRNKIRILITRKRQ